MRSYKLIITGLLALVALLMLFAAQFDSRVTADYQVEPTLDPFPRPDNLDIIVAEQVFENGRMFYLLPVDRIWVMFDAEDDSTGTWQVFEDTWTEDQIEFDPSIVAPDGLHQPIRGFGKLWRENETIREALGWALDPEIGHLTRYRYFPYEPEIVDDEVIIRPGFHTLRSYYGRNFIFNEEEGTWEVDPNSVTIPEATPAPETTPEPEATEESASLPDYSEIAQTRLPDGGFVLGNPDAPITIVEFGDFMCPFCQNYKPTVDILFEEFVFTGLAKFEYRFLPTQGDVSIIAAQLAECADELTESGFWKAYDAIFALTTDGVREELASPLAEMLEIPLDELAACQQEANQVYVDQQLAREEGIGGTPAIRLRYNDGPLEIIDGHEGGGTPLDVLRQVITTANANL